MKTFGNKGITVMEIMLVIAILGLLLGIVLPQFAQMREKQSLWNASEEVMSAISEAKANTLASVDSSEYGVHFESGAVIIFKGVSFSPGAPDNEQRGIIAPATITSVTLGGILASSGDMYFNRLSGLPSLSGVIEVATPSFVKTITIHPTGAVSAE